MAELRPTRSETRASEFRRGRTGGVWGVARALPCLCWFVAGLGCDSDAERETPTPGVRLPAGVVAKVGSAELSVEMVGRLAERRGVGARAALRLAVEDAMLAEHLSRRQPGLALGLERIALARTLLGDLLREAKAMGPPSSDEVEAVVAERWWEVARPRMVRVIHAVVLSENEDARASALAQRIRAEVSDAADAEEFRSLASRVPTDGLSVKVERLMPMTADGRAVDPDDPPPVGPRARRFAQAFARGAHELERVGQTSAVVRTPFGYHVLRAEEILPSLEPEPSVVVERVVDDVMARRATRLREEVIDRQRDAAPPRVELSALAAMASVDLER